MRHGAHLSTRGSTECRGCGTTTLASVLDLGSQPLANELLDSKDDADPTFPLHLKICANCGLGQVGEFVPPEHIFSDYPYLSSISATWLAHARRYSERIARDLHLVPTDLVIEVASNDGYLLRSFQSLGMRVLGIEPAANVASIAVDSGIPTVCKFFGRSTATEVAHDHGRPRLIVANNVMAHVPDLDDFVAGLALLCSEDTIATVENPTLLNMFLDTQFDTIYHEHFSYLTAHSVRVIARRHGLDLIRVEALPTHGGSNRYWLARRGNLRPHRSVDDAVDHELRLGLLDQHLWTRFANQSRRAIIGLREWIDSTTGHGGSVVAFGAAAKGNTLMNAAGVTASDIRFATDASHEKQGKYLPGSHIPVVHHDRLEVEKPSDVLIMPWNIADELTPLISSRVPEARIWTAIPSMRQLA